MAQTDEELIEQSKSGNYLAFEQLIYRYDENVLNIASRFTRSSEDAKDIYQETFIRVFKGLPKFRYESEFSTWVFRIATNVCLTHKERKKKEHTVSYDDEDNIDTDIAQIRSGDRTDSKLHGDEITNRIETALQELSPQQRLVFTMRYYQEYKLKDIAELMDCAEGTVKKYLFEATHRMRGYLHDLYG